MMRVLSYICFVLLVSCTSTFALVDDLSRLNRLMSGTASESSPKSVSELLEKMDRANEIPVGYFPIYKSGSPQKATPEEPRILLKWHDSVLGLIPKEEEKMEVMIFNEKTKRFEFYLYEMPFDRHNPPEKNPRACLSCHAKPAGTPPRPRWESYNLWPGFFWSNDGSLSGNEKAYFDAFMAKRSSHPVYKYLKDWPSEPYKTADCDPPSEKPSPSNPERELYRLKGSNRYRMVDFGIDLLSKQQQGIVKEILNSKKLEPFRYAILGAVLCPSKDFPVTRFVAESLIEHFPKTYQEVLEDTVEANDANYLKKYKQILENTGLQENSPELRRTEGFLSGGRSGVFGGGFYNSPEASAINARVRYVVEGAGADMSWWSLSGDRRAYTFSQGCFDFERPKYWLGLLDNENDGRLLDLLDDSMENLRAEKGRKEYSGYVLSAARRTFCEALVKRSRKFTARHSNLLEMRQ